MGSIDVDHQHAMHLVKQYDHAPTGPAPEHTMFMLLACACGHAEVFPAFNYRLTTPAFKVEFLNELLQYDLVLAGVTGDSTDVSGDDR